MSRLRDRGLSDERKDQGLLLAAIAAQGESFDILVKDREHWEMTKALLFYAVQSLEKERLTWLLAKAPDTMITPRIIAALIESQDGGKMTVLVDRYPGFKVTEGLLNVAAQSANLETFKMLVARAAKPMVTERILEDAPDWRDKTQIPKIMILLGRMEESDLTPSLMVTAAQFSDERVVEAMLQRGGARAITEVVMVEAARRGSEVFRLMLRYGGTVTNSVLDDAALRCHVSVWQVLIEQGYESSIDAKRLKLAANNDYDADPFALLSLLLDHADDSILANASEMEGLICEVARGCWECEPLRQLLDRAKGVKISQDMLLATTLNPYPQRLDKSQALLERSIELQVTEDMLVVAAIEIQERVDLLKLFLEQEGEAKISEYVLLAAASNSARGDEILQMLLEQDSAVVLTEDVLLCAAQYQSPDLVLELLERPEANLVTDRLLEAAATNTDYGGELVKSLLARAEITDVPEGVFVEATANYSNGSEVILVLEERFGRIDVTETLMEKCVHKASRNTIGLLLSRTDPANMTKTVLTRAIRDNPTDRVVSRVVEKSIHLPITSDIVELAAENVSTDLFRFLWNRCRLSSIPEDLVNAAVRNTWPGGNITSFLLHESDCVEIGEETLINLMANFNRHHTCDLFDLLIEQGLRANTTKGEPRTLLMNGGIKVRCSSPTRLQLRKGTKVTEEMFKVATSRGDGHILQKLANFCELERIPEEWLDIARLYHAVSSGNESLLKNLLERGVAFDIASPDGETPLSGAVENNQSEVVKMLLAVGSSPDGAPNSKWSPLCNVAVDGDYYIVKILVNAGASIDFKDEAGRTPAMLVKEYNKILVFKYLEECQMEQDKKKRESTTWT